MITERYKVLSADAARLKTKALRDTAENLIESGRVNADETVHVEKAATEEQWDTIFEGSIGSLLSTGEYGRPALNWFNKRSIRP